jgi:hypothetical protein
MINVLNKPVNWQDRGDGNWIIGLRAYLVRVLGSFGQPRNRLYPQI